MEGIPEALEKDSLEDEEESVLSSKDLYEEYMDFLEEKRQFEEEAKRLQAKILLERKRLKEETLFFDKKMEILKGGFAQLEADRKKLQQERVAFEQEKNCYTESQRVLQEDDMSQVLFRGVYNKMTLKKRYKDLIKIFHPDNVCGDTDTIRLINEEYERLRDVME